MTSDQLWDIASSSQLSELSDLQPLLVTQLHSLQLVRSRFESLKEETRSLTGMISDLEQEAHHFGDTAKTMYRLERDAQIKRQLYDELIQRYEMAQLTGSLGIFEQNKRVKVIDLPFTPSRPSNLPIIVFVVLGLICGAGLGVGIATLIELLDSSVRSVSEIETITGSQVITTIPRITNQ
jgi:uncharacterized protein involved in exopolysaccharide biosynthesis